MLKKRWQRAICKEAARRSGSEARAARRPVPVVPMLEPAGEKNMNCAVKLI